MYFRSSRTLDGHNKQKHQKETHKHFCNQCDWSTFEATRLRKHWKSIHAEKQLKCDKCDYLGRTVTNLQTYKNIVHVERTYDCSICEAKFKIKSVFIKHCLNEHQILLAQ